MGIDKLLHYCDFPFSQVGGGGEKPEGPGMNIHPNARIPSVSAANISYRVPGCPPALVSGMHPPRLRVGLTSSVKPTREVPRRALSLL